MGAYGSGRRKQVPRGNVRMASTSAASLRFAPLLRDGMHG
jgi:hypothetical protein